MEYRRFSPSTARVRGVSGPPPQNTPNAPPDHASGLSWWQGLDTAADGAFALAADRRITRWNLAATRIMGYDGAEILGRRCCDVFVRQGTSALRFCSDACRTLTQLKCDEPVGTFDLQTTAKGGRSIWLNISTIVLPIGDAETPRLIRIFRDVTAVKELLALIRHRLSGDPAPADPFGRLTRREVEILRLVASGATNRAVGERLHISPATVRNHTHNIFEKLQVVNRLAAVTYAISHFLI
jgi:PAS domain S-box-containing protein